MNARANSKRWRAGVLGATGMVGQRIVKLLSEHPWFELTAVAASERSTGKTYAQATRWHLEGPVPERARGLVVKDLDPSLDCDFVFSALDSSVAGEAEEQFARAGYPVVSNSKNHRMDADVPLLIPEVNAAHVNCIPVQQKNRGYDTGFIVTNPNCSTAGLVLVSEAAGGCLWSGKIVCGDAAGGFRSGLSRSSRHGRARKRGPVHQRRRRKDGSGAAEAAGASGMATGSSTLVWESARIAIACRWWMDTSNVCRCA